MPDWKPEIRAQLAGLKLEATRELGIIEELSQHLDDYHEELLNRGRSEGEAQELILVELNSGRLLANELKRTEPQMRSERIRLCVGKGNCMDRFVQDLRYAVRILRKNPGFTVVAVLTLALGIGANTAIFSIINGVLLKPLPYEEPGQLVNLWEAPPGSRNRVSSGAFNDWNEHSTKFEGLSLIRSVSINLAGEGQPEHVDGLAVSSSYLRILRLEPVFGRGFLPDEDKLGHDNKVVVLTHPLWQRRFGSDPSIVGRTIRVNGEPHTVLGVLPPKPSIAGDYRDENWQFLIPFVIGRDASPGVRDDHRFVVIGRIKQGVTHSEAQAELTAINQRLKTLYPKWKEDWGVMIVPLRDQITDNAKGTLLVLMGAVGFVLLIACSNVSNLLLAKAASRQKEMAVRAALGATRQRVIFQMLTESFLLAMCGGLLGVGLAYSGLHVFTRLSAGNLPRIDEIALDAPVMVFSLLVATATGILFGLIPALRISAPTLEHALKEAGRGSTGSHSRMQSGLIVAEVGLALVLLTGAGLLVRSFIHLINVDPGFNPQSMLAMDLSLTPASYPSDHDRAQFFERICERIEAIPGVKAAGMISRLPMQGRSSDTFVRVLGRPNHPEPGYGSLVNSTAGNCLRALGIPLLHGRPLSSRDSSTSAPPVVMASKSFVEAVFPHEDPLGRRIAFWGREWEIVGVVGNIRYRRLEEELTQHIYFPAAYLSRSGSLVVRTTGDPMALAEPIRKEILALDPEQPVSNIRTMEQAISISVSGRQLTLKLFGIFAGAALVLAVLGLYGVLAYAVSRRTHEIGIRMALGARRTDILRLIIRQGMRLVLLGLVVGILGAFGLTRVLRNHLYQVGSNDPTTFAGVSLLLAIVALMACVIPARRATKVHPMVALRHE
jgi:predicted permease